MSQRVDRVPSYDEDRDGLDQRMSAWLLDAGFLPMPVPNALGLSARDAPQRVRNWMDTTGATAILLSGGNDLGTCAERDRVETALIDHAHEHSLPLLGICRGMQMLGCWAGGELMRVEQHAGIRHAVTGELGAEEVNSFHDLALVGCPAGFATTAASPDGVLEAIRHEQLPWEGWMWHPEREASASPVDVERVRALFSA